MFRGLGRKRRFGFTLVEVLVTTVVVGVMAAVVIPAMVKQATAGDPARVASDLGSVKGAMEVFSQNVRPRMPGDIEDLINTISTTEKGLDGTVYTTANVNKWKGPYLEWTADVAGDVGGTTTVFKSGGSASVVSAFYRCPQTSTLNTYLTQSGDEPCTIFSGATNTDITESYGAVKITGIGAGSTEFDNLNEVIDGASETNPEDSGLLRQNASGTVFFLAVPFSSP